MVETSMRNDEGPMEANGVMSPIQNMCVCNLDRRFGKTQKTETIQPPGIPMDFPIPKFQTKFPRPGILHPGNCHQQSGVVTTWDYNRQQAAKVLAQVPWKPKGGQPWHSACGTKTRIIHHISYHTHTNTHTRTHLNWNNFANSDGMHRSWQRHQTKKPNPSRMQWKKRGSIRCSILMRRHECSVLTNCEVQINMCPDCDNRVEYM